MLEKIETSLKEQRVEKWIRPLENRCLHNKVDITYVLEVYFYGHFLYSMIVKFEHAHGEKLDLQPSIQRCAYFLDLLET